MPEDNGGGYIKELYVAGVALLASFLFYLKNFDTEEYKSLTRGARIRKLCYGCIGSAITSWVCFEMLRYFNVPFRLSLACSGAVAYLGGDIVSNLLLKFLERKVEKLADK